MKAQTKKFYLPEIFRGGITVLCFFVVLCFASCEKEDPKPPNEEEVITTLTVTLTPIGGGIPVNLKFFDADGEHGSIAPLITVTGPLNASTSYAAQIELMNETVNPPADISSEVSEEADHHLFCFATTGDITIAYEDEDANGLPVGLLTTWQTSVAGDAEVTITLRHQAGTKTGQCPGPGDTDVQVTFDVVVD